MYPPQLVIPMKEELVTAGFEDVTTPERAEELVKTSEGTTFVVINSVCGCAAANARPAARLAVEYSEKKPNQLATVFAGFDGEAVNKIRELSLPYPPSSPSMALFKEGELVHFVERHQIEGATAQTIAKHLIEAFDQHC